MSTIIVGTSAAGLATAACLRRLGQPFEILEASPHVANAWRNHYERLHLHTPKALSGLPYAGFPREVPKYPSREQVIAYLEDYALQHGIEPRFGQRVVSVRREGDGWSIKTEQAAFHSRNVVIATGASRVPERPSWPGLETFRGRLLHSSEYRSGAPFKGQRALVVGFGNSGGEIAIDLHEHGALPALSVRSPVNVVPRDFLGIPILAWGLLLDLLPDWLGDAIARVVSRLRFGPLARLGLRQLPYGAVTQIRRHKRIPLLDVGTLGLVRKGSIEILPGIDSFSADSVRFVDGTERRFDAVVLATGYRPGLESLLENGESALPGLYFCGFNIAVPTGGLHEIAKEARSIARSIASA